MEGLHLPIHKGYIYFAMGFSIFVEMINLNPNYQVTRATYAYFFTEVLFDTQWCDFIKKVDDIIRAWYAASVMRLAEFEGRAIEVHYEHLVAEPAVHVRALWAFATLGLDIEEPNNFDQVTQWVTPKLKHF